MHSPAWRRHLLHQSPLPCLPTLQQLCEATGTVSRKLTILAEAARSLIIALIFPCEEGVGARLYSHRAVKPLSSQSPRDVRSRAPR